MATPAKPYMQYVYYVTTKVCPWENEEVECFETAKLANQAFLFYLQNSNYVNGGMSVNEGAGYAQVVNTPQGIRLYETPKGAIQMLQNKWNIVKRAQILQNKADWVQKWIDDNTERFAALQQEMVDAIKRPSLN